MLWWRRRPRDMQSSTGGLSFPNSCHLLPLLPPVPGPPRWLQSPVDTFVSTSLGASVPLAARPTSPRLSDSLPLPASPPATP